MEAHRSVEHVATFCCEECGQVSTYTNVACNLVQNFHIPQKRTEQVAIFLIVSKHLVLQMLEVSSK